MVAQKIIYRQENKFYCWIDHFQKNIIKFLEGNKECFYYWDGVKKSSNVTAWRARDSILFTFTAKWQFSKCWTGEHWGTLINKTQRERCSLAE